jgi:hypothetical protein
MYGQDSRIGISFQNSYGTASVASLHWMEPVSESVSLQKAQIQRKGLRSGAFTDPGTQEGLNTIGGDLVIEARANQLGVMLAAINASPSTVTSAALYTHTFKPRSADHSTTSAERPFTYLKYFGDTGSAQQFSDMNAASLELSISNGELLTAKLAMVGGTFARIAAVSATYSATNPIDWSVSSASIAGVEMRNIKSLTITHENNLQAKHTLPTTNKYPTRIKRTDYAQINISGTLLFDNQTDYDDFISQTEKRFLLNLQGTATVQSGYPEYLTIDVPSMKYTEYPIPIGGPSELEVSFKARASYNTGSSTSIAYTLACGKAGF